MNKLTKITIDYPPLSNVEIPIFENVTVIGGSNGTGKTLMLSKLNNFLYGVATG